MTSNWLTPNGNPTPKWRGHSLTKLRDARATAASARQAKRVVTHALDAQIEAADDIARKEVARLLGYDADRVILGHHPCPESPSLACVYDKVEDPDRDFCLFCEDSHERK